MLQHRALMSSAAASSSLKEEKKQLRKQQNQLLKDLDLKDLEQQSAHRPDAKGIAS